jgi:hypothetical protein
VENHCNNISAELCSVLPNDHKPVVDKLIQQDLRYFARKRKWLSKNESLLNTKTKTQKTYKIQIKSTIAVEFFKKFKNIDIKFSAHEVFLE